MKFLLDVHLGRTLANLLQEGGHECRLVVEVADPRMEDVGILELEKKTMKSYLPMIWISELCLPSTMTRSLQ